MVTAVLFWFVLLPFAIGLLTYPIAVRRGWLRFEHEPRALKLLEAPKSVSDLKAQLFEAEKRAIVARARAEDALARLEAVNHGTVGLSNDYVRPVSMPIAGPGVSRRG